MPILLAFGLAVAGCASDRKASYVSVLRAEPPSLRTEVLAPEPQDGRHGLIVGRHECGDEACVKFAAVREAYWSYDTPTMLEHLRELRRREGIEEEHFHWLYLTAFERSEQWRETLPMYAELGIAEKHKGWRDYAKIFAEPEPSRIEFGTAEPVLPLTLANGDLPVVDIWVNGVKARVLVDTGANKCWWKKSFARRVGAEPLNAVVPLSDSQGSTRPASLAVFRELRIGSMTARNTVGLINSMWLWELIPGFDGIVGWDVLQHAHLVFDFPARQLTVAAPRVPMADEPLLGGRVAPLLLAKSPEGRPLVLFLDTGASGDGGVTLYENEGVLASRTSMAAFQRSWRPALSAGVHSVRVTWPKRRRDFAFWFGGFRFETKRASLNPARQRQDKVAYVDGLIGNTPFLSGRLTLCGVRRLAEFEPTPPAVKDVAVR